MRAKKRKTVKGSMKPEPLLIQRNNIRIPVIDLDLSEPSSEDEELIPQFAPISGSESFFDEDGNLHLIYTLKSEDYLKDTGINVSVGNLGVLGLNVFPVDSSRNNTWECCKQCAGQDSNQPKVAELDQPLTQGAEQTTINTNAIWSSTSCENISQILKESFGKLGLTENDKKEGCLSLEASKQTFKNPKKKVSFADEINKNLEFADGLMKKSSPILLERIEGPKQTFNSKMDLDKNNNSLVKAFSSKVDQKETNIKIKRKKPRIEPKPKKLETKKERSRIEPKTKKFKRIFVCRSSSSSESEDEPFTFNKTNKSLSSSSDSDTSSSSEKKPNTRQRQKFRDSLVLAAENYSEEDVLEQIYRYEGIFWEYDKKTPQLFNCFECSRTCIEENVVEHFLSYHSKLIAEG